jgi:hypothetical protein
VSADATGDRPHAGQRAASELSEEQLRAAYEEELSRITSADVVLQAVVSLLNLGGRRLGLATPAGEPAEAERDLEQVRDAIDGVSALMAVLERRRPDQLSTLRSALAQLQLAYAREAAAGAAAAPGSRGGAGAEPPDDSSGAGDERAGDRGEGQPDGEQSHRPGPAESSGRLWVPGR